MSLLSTDVGKIFFRLSIVSYNFFFVDDRSKKIDIYGLIICYIKTSLREKDLWMESS